MCVFEGGGFRVPERNDLGVQRANYVQLCSLA